jgi:hypothetical protein
MKGNPQFGHRRNADQKAGLAVGLAGPECHGQGSSCSFFPFCWQLSRCCRRCGGIFPSFAIIIVPFLRHSLSRRHSYRRSTRSRFFLFFLCLFLHIWVWAHLLAMASRRRRRWFLDQIESQQRGKILASRDLAFILLRCSQSAITS